MKVLCPYCGHHQKDGAEQCESCRGLFEPLSRTASQIAMGPWYLRNDAKPFLPGFSVAVLRRMAAAGKVKADTILRGPTTHQLWAYAKHTPGVAHLIGVCHACGSAVDPHADRCGSCGESFATPTDRDLLGLPTMPTQQAIAERRRVNGSLCPVCAGESVDAGRCAACERVFEPVDRATRVTLGPWQLRDSKLPLVTGMSIVQLRQKIEAGEVEAGSILRGPTTHQFFSVVRHTPGVAHLVGKCYNCGGFVKATDTRCGNCAADLMVSVAPDRLGLMFRTDDEAAEAQQRLDAQIAAVNDPQVQKPLPMATPKKPAPGGAAPSSPPPAPPAAPPTPPPPTPAAAPVADAEAEADALADQAAAGAPRVRHAGLRRERSNPWVMLLTGVITLVVFGSIFYVIAQNLGARDDGYTDPEPDPVTAVDTGPQTANPVQTRDYTALSGRVNALTQQEQTARIKPLVDDAVAQLTTVKEAWDGGRIREAVARFDTLKDKLKAAEAVIASRDRAIALRGDAKKAADDADGEEAPDIAPDHWKKAEATAAAAAATFKAEKYEDAEQGWRDSITQYKDAMAQVEAAHTAERLRRTFDTKLVATFTKEQVEIGGGALLAEAAKLLTAGEAEYKLRKYTEAVATYKRAHELIGEIELAVKRAIGVHYWAMQTGRLAADLLMQRAAGKPLSDEHRKQFAVMIENLRLEGSLAAGLPADASPPFADLAKAVVEAPAAAITAQRGSDAEVSFRLGIQLRVMEQLLEADGDLMSAQDDAEIRRILSAMAKDAETAGYPQPFADRLDEIKTKLVIRPKFEAVRQARIAWAKFRDDLAEFEKAMAMIPLSRQP